MVPGADEQRSLRRSAVHTPRLRHQDSPRGRPFHPLLQALWHGLFVQGGNEPGLHSHGSLNDEERLPTSLERRWSRGRLAHGGGNCSGCRGDFVQFQGLNGDIWLG